MILPVPKLTLLFFIYLNEKKDSKQAISAYRKLEKSKLQPIISKINQLTFDISECTSLTKFNTLITSHEILLSSLLKTPTVKQTHRHKKGNGIFLKERIHYHYSLFRNGFIKIKTCFSKIIFAIYSPV